MTPKVTRPPSAAPAPTFRSSSKALDTVSTFRSSSKVLESRLLSVFDVAAVLAVKPPKVRMLAARGSIAYHRVGRALRFSRGDLDAFLARCRRPARAERGL